MTKINFTPCKERELSFEDLDWYQGVYSERDDRLYVKFPGNGGCWMCFNFPQALDNARLGWSKNNVKQKGILVELEDLEVTIRRK